MSKLEEIVFNTSDPFTLGVELEFQLLDKDTLNLTHTAPTILESVPDSMINRIKPEFIQSMIEVNTDICPTVADVDKNLSDICRYTETLAEKHDTLLYAASLHPFARIHEQVLSPNERYGRIMEDLQLIGRRFITQGLHVHVGISDSETAIKVCDNIRIYLPVLLALTTSSPFYEGWDTGLQSYRSKLFEALPLAGIPDHLVSWNNYKNVANLLFSTEIIREVRDLWWDVRPHPDFGTIEVRICDLPSRYKDILALVALIQALVVTLARSENGTCSTEAMPCPNMQILRSNKWQAARYGTKGTFVDPLSIEKKTMADAASDLLKYVAPVTKELQTENYILGIENILANGTSTDQQRKIYWETGNYSSVIEEMRKEFWQ